MVAVAPPSGASPMTATDFYSSRGQSADITKAMQASLPSPRVPVHQQKQNNNENASSPSSIETSAKRRRTVDGTGQQQQQQQHAFLQDYGLTLETVARSMVDATAQDLMFHKRGDLQEQCRAVNLMVSGNKTELALRIATHAVDQRLRSKGLHRQPNAANANAASTAMLPPHSIRPSVLAAGTPSLVAPASALSALQMTPLTDRSGGIGNDEELTTTTSVSGNSTPETAGCRGDSRGMGGASMVWPSVACASPPGVSTGRFLHGSTLQEYAYQQYYNLGPHRPQQQQNQQITGICESARARSHSEIDAAKMIMSFSRDKQQQQQQQWQQQQSPERRSKTTVVSRSVAMRTHGPCRRQWPPIIPVVPTPTSTALLPMHPPVSETDSSSISANVRVPTPPSAAELLLASNSTNTNSSSSMPRKPKRPIGSSSSSSSSSKPKKKKKKKKRKRALEDNNAGADGKVFVVEAACAQKLANGNGVKVPKKIRQKPQQKLKQEKDNNNNNNNNNNNKSIDDQPFGQQDLLLPPSFLAFNYPSGVGGLGDGGGSNFLDPAGQFSTHDVGNMSAVPNSNSVQLTLPENTKKGRARMGSAGSAGGTERRAQRWSEVEDDQLSHAVSVYGASDWKAIAALVPGRTHEQCLQRWRKVLDPKVVKGKWSKDEDDLLLRRLEGKPLHKHWGQVAMGIAGRTAKQCRERYHSHLDPTINKGHWLQQEDLLIVQQQRVLGNRWAEISRELGRLGYPGRTENSVKIRFKVIRRAQTRVHSHKQGEEEEGYTGGRGGDGVAGGARALASSSSSPSSSTSLSMPDGLTLPLSHEMMMTSAALAIGNTGLF